MTDGGRGRRWARPIRHGYFLAGAIFAGYVFLVLAPRVGSVGYDAFAYWSAAPPLYDQPVGALGAYNYSPAFYQVTAPLRALPWASAWFVWTALLIGTAVWLGPLALAFPPVALELYHGNIHLLIAAAIVLGFRYPAAWAFVLHTKATCGVGLLWFAVRREWRQLGIAIGTAAAIAAVSFVFLPGAWTEYVAFLVSNAGASPYGVPIPLVVRVPLAAVFVIWGARTGRAWTVPAAAALALPHLWFAGVAVAAGAFAIRAPGARKTWTRVR